MEEGRKSIIHHWLLLIREWVQRGCCGKARPVNHKRLQTPYIQRILLHPYSKTRHSLVMDFTTFSNIIDGKPRGADISYHGINPSTEDKLWDVPCATEEDLNDAVTSARKAFPSWSNTPFEKRCELVRQYAEAFVAEEEGFTELLMKETGKPVCLGKGLPTQG